MKWIISLEKVGIVIAGVNTSFAGIHLESEEKTLIWFSLNENHFIVFKKFIDASNEVMIESWKLNKTFDLFLNSLKL